MNSCVFIQGPTATGKSRLGMDLAQKIGGCIVNADSIQLYQSLKIGSAAPSDEDKKKVDHFLFQVIPKGQTWTASEYENQAWEVVSRELKKRPVVVVGGSGFYFRALEHGMGASQAESREVKAQLEGELREKGAKALHEELSKEDPPSALKIHMNDHYRLLRALGYFRTYGRPFSEDQKLQQKRKWPGSLLKMGLTATQAQLKEIIEKRTQKMLQEGFIDEVKTLISEGLSQWKPLQSVGYKEVMLFCAGELSREDLVPQITQKTLSLAKRQKTWFQRDEDVKWFSFEKKDQALTWIMDRLP